MEAKIYNREAKEAGKITLPESLFDLPWNVDLVHQAAVSMAANARHGNAHTKTRGEVRGGGRKPWRQKGTGRARHGSTRSPIWVGGGVAHGPRNDKDFSKKVNRKMAGRALFVVLSQKLRDGEIVFVDSLHQEAPSAKAAKAFLAAFARNIGPVKKRNAALIAFSSKDVPAMKSFGNFGNVATEEVRNLNPRSVLSAKYLVIEGPEAALAVLRARKGAQSNKAPAK